MSNQVEIQLGNMATHENPNMVPEGPSGRLTPGGLSTISMEDVRNEEQRSAQYLKQSAVHNFFHGSSRTVVFSLLKLLFGVSLCIVCSLALTDHFYKEESVIGENILNYAFCDVRSDQNAYPIQPLIEVIRWLCLAGFWAGSFLTCSNLIFLLPQAVRLVCDLPENVKGEIVHFYALSAHFSRCIAFLSVYVFSLRLFGYFTIEPAHIMERSYEFLSRSAITFTTLVFLARYLRKLALQRIAINFHNIHYADRAKENNAKVGIINALKKYVLECQPYDPQLFEGLKVTDTLAVFSNAQNIHSSDKEGDVLASHMKEIEECAPILSKAIIKALRPADRSKGISITPQDFIAVFQKGSEVEAFQMLDRDGSGDLSKKELCFAIVDAYQERASILKGLEENETIVSQLDHIIGVLFWISTIYLWMNVFDYNISSIATVFTLLTGITWVFSEIVTNVFNSIIFIFITHPYDVGDRIIFDDGEVEVVEISLLTTTFLKPNGELMYFRNAALVGKKVTNIRRSGNQNDVLKFSVPAAKSSIDKMTLLREKFLAFFTAHSRDYIVPDSFFFFEVKDLNTFEVSVKINYRGNFQDVALTASRKNALSTFFADTVDQLGLSK